MMFTIRSLKLDELDSWFDFLVREVFVDDTRDYFVNHWKNDWHQNVDGILIAVDDDGKIAASMRVYLRELYFGGGTVPSAIIGEVGSRPDVRGKGLISELFQACFSYLEKNGVVFSYLFSGEENEGFYNHQGYQRLRYPLMKAEFSERASFGNFPVAIRKADCNIDTALLSQMYQSTSINYNGPVVRSDAYWKEWVAGESNPIWFALDAQGRETAYLKVGEDAEKQILYLDEYGCMPGNESLLASFIAKLRDEKYPSCQWLVQPGCLEFGLEAAEVLESGCTMFRLNESFELAGELVRDTAELLEKLEGSEGRSRAVFWFTDNA